MLSCAALLSLGVADAQTHYVPAKPKDVLRAVGVYEWTGDIAKPTASRLIPVSLYINNHFEDAAIYLARPVPLTLDTGTLYEVDLAGEPKGYVGILNASHLHATNSTVSFDDGWFGYGKWKPFEPPKPVIAKNARPANVIQDVDDDQPHFAHKPMPQSDSGTAPTTSKGNTGAPTDDPDRPVLKRKTSNDDTATPASTPTTVNETASVTTAGANTLTGDPNRPKLHRGKSADDAGAVDEAKDFIPLNGIPAGLHQMAAVSDAAIRPAHSYLYAWESTTLHDQMQAKLEEFARAALAEAGAKPVPAPAASTSVNSKLRHAHTAETLPPPAPLALLDENFTAYALSYEGDWAMVLSARCNGPVDKTGGLTTKYVTIVAQQDIYGEVKPLIKSVADTSHLDTTPWMRLIDAVDADGSNRAALLFELRGQSSRQFALYRILHGTAEQIYITGSTQ